VLHDNPLTPGERLGGLVILLFGWLQTFYILSVGPFVALTWWANVTIPIVWVLIIMRRYKGAVKVAFSGLALSLIYLVGNRVATDESGGWHPIHYGSAYWIWVSSFCFALGAAVIGARYDSQGVRE
jgi:hypothetical protein